MLLAYSFTSSLVHFFTHSQLYFYIHARRQIELHQRIDCLVGRIDNVHQPQMRADLELVARGLVSMRRTQHVKTFLARRKRHRTLDHGPSALCGIHDLERRLVDQAVVERLEANTYFLAFDCGHYGYSMTLATTPAPTVLPPSRIAKRSPSSIAMGWIKLTVIEMLSPGITISVPAG